MVKGLTTTICFPKYQSKLLALYFAVGSEQFRNSLEELFLTVTFEKKINSQHTQYISHDTLSMLQHYFS